MGGPAKETQAYFYPRSPCGERPLSSSMSCWACLFLSTLSLRRATGSWQKNATTLVNFYPRSPCGERRQRDGAAGSAGDFYPRSPCGERPKLGVGSPPALPFLSTLSLRRATLYFMTSVKHSAFLSTLSLRRATLMRPGTKTTGRHFYPRSPCGERRF